ncbi:unnamed protein product, partial [Larinioides sclopetarius]
MSKKQAILSRRVRGKAYCSYFRSNHYQPVIDSSKDLASICPDSRECIEAKNISDAESVVAKLPNSSKAWVDGALMPFHYSGLDKAKEFLRRGIETISSRFNQNNQTKEPVLEANVELESVNSEKVNLKEESSESDLSEPSHSPQQFRFQHIFTNRGTQNSIYGTGFENSCCVRINSQASE